MTILSRAGTPVGAPVTSRPRKLDVNRARVAVNEAETRLKEAQADLHEAEKAEARQKLAEVRRMLAEQEAQLKDITAEIEHGRGALAHLQADFDSVTNEISQLTLERPSVADALPDDPEVVAWQKRYDHLQALRKEAIERREDFTMPDTMDAVRLDQSITQLKYAEQNLLRKLNGESVGWKGRVNRVL